MLVLGIETSCDETAIAVVQNGKHILSNTIVSQHDLVAKYGGVYPELASRRHVEICDCILSVSLQQAQVSLEDIDLIAVTQGPGLIGSLLVGLNFAKGLAFQLKKPIVGVNHLEAHLYAAMIDAAPALPAIGLIISGGHTSLVLIDKSGGYSLIGQTQDDAIGEAFDKVARMLDLPYPGGPAIEALAYQGDPHYFPFKPSHIKNHPFDFSFSGLKTAVVYQLKKNSKPNHEEKAHLAASFQRAAFQTLAEKLKLAFQKIPIQSIVLGGGVSNSQSLRNYLSQQISLPLYWPGIDLCLDNGAMIAGLGFHIYQNEGAHALNIPVKPRIPFKRLYETNSSTFATATSNRV